MNLFWTSYVAKNLSIIIILFQKNVSQVVASLNKELYEF